MMLRVPKYGPLHGRLIRLEEGPPMYRMLGYADKGNVMADLCEPIPEGFIGLFALPRLPPNETLPIGPGRYGLPTLPLPYTTVYYDDKYPPMACLHAPYHLLETKGLSEPRAVEVFFPESAIPGTGVLSRVTNSGFLYQKGLPPPKHFTESENGWIKVSNHSGTFTL